MGRGNSRVPFVENGYYHIYNRGYNRQTIFHNKDCYDRFYTNMVRYLKDFKDIKIVSYCLLPNHFHLVVHNISGTGTNVSTFMKLLQGAYSIWHRNKFPIEMKEPFFEGRFKAKYIKDEKYLSQCMAYVNFNPIKHELVDSIDEYPYTSYHQFRDKDRIDGYKDLLLEDLEL